MKKILIIISILVFSCHTLAHEFINDKEYTTKHKSVYKVPDVMEFFSFFCPYCYEFEKKYNTKKLVQNHNKNIHIQKYHVNFLGGQLSYILTKSWIIAQSMGIEEKIILPIFKGIQETHIVKDINSIKKIFKNQAGINEETFNKIWNSFSMEILIQKKNQEQKKSKLDRVPAMLIKGKYIIDYSKIEHIFQNHFKDKYVELIKFLINKK